MDEARTFVFRSGEKENDGICKYASRVQVKSLGNVQPRNMDFFSPCLLTIQPVPFYTGMNYATMRTSFAFSCSPRQRSSLYETLRREFDLSLCMRARQFSFAFCPLSTDNVAGEERLEATEF